MMARESDASTVTLSIIIPCYNQGEYLVGCVESISQQGVETSAEIVIVDDGSQDETAAIAGQLVDKHPNVIFFRKENGGAASARNHGAKMARGEWLMFLDADDQLQPDSLVSLLVFLAQLGPGVDMALGDMTYVENEGATNIAKENPELGESCESRFQQYMENRIVIVQGSWVIKKQAFSSILFPAGFKTLEDVIFYFIAFSCLNAVRYPGFLARYYVERGVVRKRIRENLELGFDGVDYIFCHERTPPEFSKKYKRKLVRKRAKSLFRMAKKNGFNDRLICLHFELIKRDPVSILNVSLWCKLAVITLARR